jgi:hypothetical protein
MAVLLVLVLPAAFYGGFVAGRLTSTGAERLAALGVGVVGWYVLGSLVSDDCEGSGDCTSIGGVAEALLGFGALGMWIIGVAFGALTGRSER